MAIFLSVFITLYGSLHFYAFWKTGRAFGFQKGLALPLALFMVFMVICPILVRVVERQGMEPLARVLAYVGYVWAFCSSLWPLRRYWRHIDGWFSSAPMLWEGHLIKGSGSIQDCPDF